MDGKLSFLQWNCQGMQAKFEALKILIQDKFPVCVSLQETMLGNKILCPRDYVFYHTNYDEERGNSGGSALLIRRDLPHVRIPLQTELQAVAAQIHLTRTVSFTYIYVLQN